jgi:predicted metal-dependent hydrolase
MADITVRKVAFEFPDDLPVLVDPDRVRFSCEVAGLSFTLPYLEPYLIRTMRAAGKEASDDVAQDMRNFSAQEAYHHRNHSRINDVVRVKLSSSTAEKVQSIEDAMEADYRRFTVDKSLKFNLAYAEAFEAMTLALALTVADPRFSGFDNGDAKWGLLLGWHLAEEVEHRTVTFDAYDDIFGDYLYRLRTGLWSQWHFLRYIQRFANAIQADFRHLDPHRYQGVGRGMLPRLAKAGGMGRFTRTFRPRYNPGDIEAPAIVTAILEGVDAMVAADA